MSSPLDQSLAASDIAVCVKDVHGKVISQNDHCLRLCGERSGAVCTTGCMALHAADGQRQWKDQGSRMYPNSCIHGGFFDVTLLCGVGHIITFLQPLVDRYEEALAWYRGKGLTRRELEVVAFSIRGASNAEICRSLSISKATLRTHLNNIYRKFRDLGESPEFMPAARTAGH